MTTKHDLTENKEILKRLEALEELIKKPRMADLDPCTKKGHCVDFSALPPGNLGNPFIVVIYGRTLTFSTTDPAGLKIEPHPASYGPGLKIPIDLTITVSPSSIGTVEFEVSSYAQLSWMATDSNGKPIASVPDSPTSIINGTLSVTINGAIEKISFDGTYDESNIKEICYFGKY